MDSSKMYTHERLSEFVDDYRGYIQKKKEEQDVEGSVSNYKYYNFDYNPNGIITSSKGRYSNEVLSTSTLWKPLSFKNGIDGWKMTLAKGLTQYKIKEQDKFKSQSSSGLNFIINYDELPNGVYYGQVNIDIDKNFYALRVASKYNDRGTDNSVLGTTSDLTTLNSGTKDLLFKQKGDMSYKLVTVDWYGLFYGEIGNYRITCNGENCTFYVWYGDTAVCEYTHYNCIINNNQTQSKELFFSNNKYVPIRIQCYYYGNVQSAVSFNVNVQKVNITDNSRSYTDVPLEKVFFNSLTPPLVLYYSFVSLNQQDFINDVFQCISIIDIQNDEIVVNDNNGLLTFYSVMRQYLSNCLNGDYDYNNDNRLSYGVIPDVNVEYTIKGSDGNPFAYSVYKMDSDIRMGKIYQINTKLNDNIAYDMKELDSKTKDSILTYASNYTTYPGFYPNKNSVDIQYYNQATNVSPNDCEKKCNENANCGYYFTYKSLGNDKCVINNNNDQPFFNRVLPTNSHQPIDKGSSSLNMRNYQLNLTPDQQECLLIKSTESKDLNVINTSNYSDTFEYSNYNMDLNPVISESEKLGVCGDETYVKMKNDAANMLFKDTTYYKNGAWVENFDNKEPASKYTNVVDDTSEAIRGNLKNERIYSEKSKQINKKFDELRVKIPEFKKIRNVVKSKEKYDYDNDDLYFRKRRLPTLMEKKITDNNQQYLNTKLLYTLGTLSCTTLIIFAIIIARE